MTLVELLGGHKLKQAARGEPGAWGQGHTGLTNFAAYVWQGGAPGADERFVEQLRGRFEQKIRGEKADNDLLQAIVVLLFDRILTDADGAIPEEVARLRAWLRDRGVAV